MSPSRRSSKIRRHFVDKYPRVGVDYARQLAVKYHDELSNTAYRTDSHSRWIEHSSAESVTRASNMTVGGESREWCGDRFR